LNPTEVEELTDRKTRPAQCRALLAMSIPFRPNAAGRPLVERAAVLRYRDAPGRKPTEPDWSALDHAA
jgi:hypothetical protein